MKKLMLFSSGPSFSSRKISHATLNFGIEFIFWWVLCFLGQTTHTSEKSRRVTGSQFCVYPGQWRAIGGAWQSRKKAEWKIKQKKTNFLGFHAGQWLFRHVKSTTLKGKNLARYKVRYTVHWLHANKRKNEWKGKIKVKKRRKVRK